MCGAKAKVHVNGMFTQSFSLERGVWQGDPMSPLLFALSSQLLMCILEDCKVKEELVSLKVSEQKHLLYQLFADDACLFLQNSLIKVEYARA